MKTTLIVLISFFLLASSCSDKPQGFIPTLPPITTTGENTFGCYIDGQLLTPRDKIDWESSAKGITYRSIICSSENIFSRITIIDAKSEEQGSFLFHLPNFSELDETTYSIMDCRPEVLTTCEENPTINMRCGLWHKDASSESNKGYGSIQDTGTLTVSRIDHANKIVSGTFSFSAVNRDDSTDIIEVTDGRFDINWGTVHETDFP